MAPWLDTERADSFLPSIHLGTSARSAVPRHDTTRVCALRAIGLLFTSRALLVVSRFMMVHQGPQLVVKCFP